MDQFKWIELIANNLSNDKRQKIEQFLVIPVITILFINAYFPDKLPPFKALFIWVRNPIDILQVIVWAVNIIGYSFLSVTLLWCIVLFMNPKIRPTLIIDKPKSATDQFDIFNAICKRYETSFLTSIFMIVESSLFWWVTKALQILSVSDLSIPYQVWFSFIGLPAILFIIIPVIRWLFPDYFNMSS